MTKNKEHLIHSEASLFLSMHYQQINYGIQLLACNLGTEFAMLCSIYYLLFDSEIFSDFFLEEFTVLLKKFKKSLINAVNLIL